ncbi:unnamed protein product [Rotaria sp. Silwood1]|nr:unnamed protein product [Rotaria sp. Silwood1]
MQSLSAILLIINGTRSRRTFNVEYVLQLFRHWLPNAVLENVVILLTNCKRHTFNFEPETIGLPSIVKIYYMQNSAFSNNPRKLNHEFKECLEHDWKESMNTMKKLIDLLEHLPPVSTQVFRDMDSEKNELKSLLHDSRLIIKEMQALDDVLEAKATLDRIHKSYTTTSVPYHNTLCSNCHYVCHERCQLNETKNQGDDTLSQCAAFNFSGQCKNCPGLCHVKQHYHARKLIKQTDRTQLELLKSIEAEQALKSRAAIDKKLQNQLDEIKHRAEYLIDTCAEFNIADEFYIFVGYLQTDMKLLKSADAKRQANDFLKKVKAVCDELANKQPHQSATRTDEHLATTNPEPVPSKVPARNRSQPSTEEACNYPAERLESQKSSKEKTIEYWMNHDKMDTDAHYHGPVSHGEHHCHVDEDATNSRRKEFEEEIERHMCTKQDEDELHLLKLYRSLNTKDRNALLRSTEKLAGIPSSRS